jgi:hypothetical protein
MKHFFWILITAGLYTACKDPVPEPPSLSDDYWGESSAQKNGELWTADPSCFIDIIDGETINIALDSFFESYYLKEGLYFREVFAEIGTYKIVKWNAVKDGQTDAFLNVWSGDQSLGAYDILESDSTNRLILESYDTLSKEIRGKFDLTFIVRKRPYPNAPDTIRFREGKFHGKLHKK